MTSETSAGTGEIGEATGGICLGIGRICGTMVITDGWGGWAGKRGRKRVGARRVTSRALRAAASGYEATSLRSSLRQARQGEQA